jgi:hypothetical protein
MVDKNDAKSKIYPPVEERGTSRREVLQKIAWTAPIIASIQLSGSQLAHAASPPGTTPSTTVPPPTTPSPMTTS